MSGTRAGPQRASMSLAEVESRQRVSDGLIRDHPHDADADLGAGAAYVPGTSDTWTERNPIFKLPSLAPHLTAPAPAPRRLACGCVSRFELVAACAGVAEQVEREGLGSPIAQDTARRIKLAILALR